VDKVICNPPYSHSSSALSSPVRSRSVARTQEDHTLDCFLKGAFQILKGKGKLFMVYPAAQMLELMKKLQQYHLEPKRFQLVYPFVNKPANLVLMEAQKDAKPMLHPCPPLIVYEENGVLTNKLKSVYHIEE
jgi:Predicted O-methyltransferase